MSLLLALALQGATPHPLPAQTVDEADIVVTAAKLNRLWLDLNIVDGKMSGCRVKVSSSDRFIDDLACKKAYVCSRRSGLDRRGLLDCVNSEIVSAVAAKRAATRKNINAQD